MTMLGAKQVRHNMVVYPRTWRWLRWHFAYLIITGLVAVLVHTGFFV